VWGCWAFVGIVAALGASLPVKSLDDAPSTDVADLRRRIDAASKSVHEVQSLEHLHVSKIKQQREDELARLQSQHETELAAEKQQQKLEWEDLTRQHQQELKKLEDKIKIREDVSARVMGGTPVPVMKTPEVMKLRHQQKVEGEAIKSQRDAELEAMSLRFKAEKKQQLSQREKELRYTKRRFSEKLTRRQEQLAFYRFQERQQLETGETQSTDELGESMEVDSLSKDALQHRLVGLEAKNSKLEQKLDLLLDSSSVASENMRLKALVHQLQGEKAAEDNENTILQSKLKIFNKVFPSAHQIKTADNVNTAEATMAVP